MTDYQAAARHGALGLRDLAGLDDRQLKAAPAEAVGSARK